MVCVGAVVLSSGNNRSALRASNCRFSWLTAADQGDLQAGDGHVQRFAQDHQSYYRWSVRLHEEISDAEVLIGENTRVVVLVVELVSDGARVPEPRPARAQCGAVRNSDRKRIANRYSFEKR